MSTIVKKTDVPSVLLALKKEHENIKAVVESPFKTSAALDLSQIGLGKLNTIKDVDLLIKAHAVLKRMKVDYDESAASLMSGQQVKSWTMNGNTFEDIEHDIKLQINIINVDDRKKELDALIKEAESFMTKEDQYALFIDKVKKTVKA